MNKLFGTSALIDDAASTMKPRHLIIATLICLLVYLIGSVASAIILSFAMVILVFTDNDLMSQILTNPEDTDGLNDAVMKFTEEIMPTANLIMLFLTVFTIIAALFYCKKLEKRSFFSMGFHKKGAALEYLAGLAIGLVMFGLVFVLMWASGSVTEVSFNRDVSVPMLLLFFLGFVIQGASEEILLRGYYFVTGAVCSKSARYNIAIALFASSALFSLLHLGNSGISLLSIINLFLFGVFAGLYFLRRGSIWGIAAIHTVWNFAQGNLFGCQVSGMVMGDSLLQSAADESKWLLNGGAFGPEGGLCVTLILTLGIVILAFMKNKEIKRDIYEFSV